MAEEVADPAIKVPRAMTYAVPVLGIFGLFFIIPICVTMPEDLLEIVSAPYFQSLPYIYAQVMGSPGGGVALTALVLAVTAFCSISITCAASRCTWAMARDRALPLSGLFSRVDKRLNVPVWAVVLVTIVQMLLGLINLGSTSAFTAFISVGVIALAVSYAIPILISMTHGRRDVSQARWTTGRVGWLFNVVAVAWIAFETVLFSMPLALPTTTQAMNYASVVLVGFGVFAAVWYMAYARKGKSRHLDSTIAAPTYMCFQFTEALLHRQDFDGLSTRQYSSSCAVGCIRWNGTANGSMPPYAAAMTQLAPFIPFSWPHLKHFDKKSGATKRITIEPSQFQT